jgi:hypothetical protein
VQEYQLLRARVSTIACTHYPTFLELPTQFIQRIHLPVLAPFLNLKSDDMLDLHLTVLSTVTIKVTFLIGHCAIFGSLSQENCFRAFTLICNITSHSTCNRFWKDSIS